MNTFQNYIVSDCNRFAYGCAKIISENPAQDINPLFIYGEDGKTHLIEAIRDAHAKNHHLETVYYTGSRFTEDYINAIQTGNLGDFRNRIRQADAFFLDEAESISGKQRTQEELIHLLKAFIHSGRQVVITSSSPIHTMKLISNEIKTYLSGGVIAEIKQPDVALLESLIHQQSDQLGIEIQPNDIENLLINGFTSVRSVIGFLRQCKATMNILGIEKLNIEHIMALRNIATANKIE